MDQNKQTAIEWLFLMLNNPNRDQEFANKLFDQAKEMERAQRIKDYNAGYVDAQVNHINDAVNYVYESEYINSKQ